MLWTLRKPHKTIGTMPKVNRLFALESDQLAALKAISKATGIPMAVLVRSGVDKVIAQYRKHAKSRK